MTFTRTGFTQPGVFTTSGLTSSLVNGSQVLTNPTSAKGDLIVNNGTGLTALNAGSNNYVLTADSSSTEGVKWAALPATPGSTIQTNNNYSLALSRSKAQYLTLANANETNLKFSGNYTIEAYVNLLNRPATSEQYGILSRWTATITGLRSWSTMLENNGGAYGMRIDTTATGATNDTLRVVTEIAANSWTHYAFVYVLSEKKLYGYVNGLFAGSSASGGQATINSGSGDVYAGAKFPGSNVTDGLIGYIRAWNVARTQQEIADNINTQIGSATSLVLSLQMQNNTNDSSTSANNFVASGAPIFTAAVPFQTYTVV